MEYLERLLQVQEIDCQVREMERELKDLPERKKREEARLQEFKAAVAKAEDDLKKIQAEMKKLELDVQSNQDRIRKFRQQQIEIKTNKEFKALETEVKGVEDQIKGIEDRELAFMEQIESQKLVLLEKEGTLSSEEQKLRIDLKVWDERIVTLEKELAGVKAQGDTLRVTIPPKVLQNYARIFQRRDKAVVAIEGGEEGGVCGGCHMKLPPYVIHSARKRTELVGCSFCGRLLY